MFDDGGEGGEFDGAFRERAAPKIPPRRRRGAAAAGDESQGETAEPAVKKQGGWADEGSSAQQPMGRRRDGGGAATETQAVDAPASSKFDDDDDIPVIPDLEENDEDDITLTVAEPGSISNVVLPTDLKLDTGKLPPPQVSSKLCSSDGLHASCQICQWAKAIPRSPLLTMRLV